MNTMLKSLLRLAALAAIGGLALLALPVYADAGQQSYRGTVTKPDCEERSIAVHYGPPGKGWPVMRKELRCEEADFAAFESEPGEAARRKCREEGRYTTRYSFVQHAIVRVPGPC